MERDEAKQTARAAIQFWIDRKNSAIFSGDEIAETPILTPKLVRIAVRHQLYIHGQIEQFLQRWPSPQTSAALVLATAELMESPEEDRPKIIHFWVDRVGEKKKKEKPSFKHLIKKVKY